MEDKLESKLESYRLRKRRTEKLQSLKDKIFGMLTQSKDDSETKVKIEVISKWQCWRAKVSWTKTICDLFLGTRCQRNWQWVDRVKRCFSTWNWLHTFPLLADILHLVCLLLYLCDTLRNCDWAEIWIRLLHVFSAYRDLRQHTSETKRKERN